MRLTIDFDDNLHRRLEIEAARRGRTIGALVAEAVRRVLDGEQGDARALETTEAGEWRPDWLGVLQPWAASVDDHSMAAIRERVARGRRQPVVRS
jgi:predicted transcriptional regulator